MSRVIMGIHAAIRESHTDEVIRRLLNILTSPDGKTYLKTHYKFMQEFKRKLVEFYIYNWVLEARDLHKVMFGDDFSEQDIKHVCQHPPHKTILHGKPVHMSYQVCAIIRSYLDSI